MTLKSKKRVCHFECSDKEVVESITTSMKRKVIRSFGDYEFPVLLLEEINTEIPFVIVKVNKYVAIRSSQKGW